jgi:hypothetical protein
MATLSAAISNIMNGTRSYLTMRSVSKPAQDRMRPSTASTFTTLWAAIGICVCRFASI